MGVLRDPKHERAFRHDRYEQEMKTALRWSAWSVVVVYAAFGLVDMIIVPDQLELALALRYGMAVPISLVIAVLTLTRHAPRFVTAIGVTHSLIGPALFITVGAVAEDPGGILFLLWGAILFPILVPQLTKLSVAWSLIVAAIALAYLVVAGLVLGARPLAVDLFAVLFFCVGAGYGTWATYTSELAGRRAWWRKRLIAWQLDELAAERERSERLLLNVLPESIANRLRRGENTIADTFEEVTVLFADIVGFTSYSARVPAEELVGQLDAIFSAFDRIADELGLEKIKTIGDAYMAAGGLPEDHPDATGSVARMALAMNEAMERINRATGEELAVRIGVHTGPVVAGVIGKRKFIYDVWGDTVNTASRMESHGAAGRVQVSDVTAERLSASFELEERGPIEVKGKGKMKTWWLIAERELTK